MSARNPVIGVLTQPAVLSVDVVSGTAFELLVGLFALTSPDRGDTWAPANVAACPPATRHALEAVGDPTGELWLHLLGLVLTSGNVDSTRFVEHLRRVKPLELRRRLLGRYVPSWCRKVGAETIERAARGEPRARRELRRAAADYCDDSAASFDAILPLTAGETKARIVAAVDCFAREVLSAERSLGSLLDADAHAKRLLATEVDPYELISEASGGYRYEQTFNRVALVPQLAAKPAILLAEENDVYMIVYPAATARDTAADLATLGRALADTSRVAILMRLRGGERTLGQLAEAVGLAKSTTHHHLVQLRAAGLVTVHGNPQGHYYALDPEGVATAGELLDSLNAWA